jgi:hypothetical protein
MHLIVAFTGIHATVHDQEAVGTFTISIYKIIGSPEPSPHSFRWVGSNGFFRISTEPDFRYGHGLP